MQGLVQGVEGALVDTLTRRGHVMLGGCSGLLLTRVIVGHTSEHQARRAADLSPSRRDSG